MNCLLFDTPAPFELKPSDPKLEHINSVLKLGDGDEIFAGQKNSILHICKIEHTANGGMLLTPIRTTSNPEQLDITLSVSFARPQIAQRLLFESACFGVKNLIFYAASKGEKDYIKSGLYAKGEYQKWLGKGAEQACATSIPNFFTAENLSIAIEKMSELTPCDTLKIAPDVYEAEMSIMRAITPNKHISAILGSERGFANDDRKILRENGYTLVSLGNRVLRTDSATIATLSIIAASY